MVLKRRQSSTTENGERKDMEVDVSLIPFSYKGSLLSLSTKSGFHGKLTPGHQVYLITQCREYTMPMFAIRPLPENANLDKPAGSSKTTPSISWQATRSRLQWKHKDSVVVEAAFQNPRCLRLRGKVPLALDNDRNVDPGCHLFQQPPVEGEDQTVVYGSTRIKNYSFVAVNASLSVTFTGKKRKDHSRIRVDPVEGNDEWEILIWEEETSAPSEIEGEESIDEAKAIPFEVVAWRSRQKIEQFTRDLCPWQSRHAAAEKLACYIIWLSIVRAGGLWTRETILMSKLWMNKIWSWDNCFNALGMVGADPRLALDQILAFHDMQAPDGRLPDCIGYTGVEWTYVKPPIQGWAIQKLLQRTSDVEHEDTVALYEHTARLTSFWIDQRRAKYSAIPWYADGDDSGWDNSTAFDGHDVLVSPDCAAYLLVQTDVLAKLSRVLSKPKSEQSRWLSLHNHLKTALIDELWDGDGFKVKHSITGETWKTTSLIRLMPLVAAEFLPSSIVKKMISDIPKFLTQYGLASEELSSPLYESDGYWRGPIWGATTLLIESGLRQAGETEMADTIAERFLRLCEKAGFAENYDAIEGVGLRDRSYTWTASVYLVLAREAAERGGRE